MLCAPLVFTLVCARVLNYNQQKVLVCFQVHNNNAACIVSKLAPLISDYTSHHIPGATMISFLRDRTRRNVKSFVASNDRTTLLLFADSCVHKEVGWCCGGDGVSTLVAFGKCCVLLCCLPVRTNWHTVWSAQQRGLT